METRIMIHPRFRLAIHLFLVLALFAPLLVWMPVQAAPEPPFGGPVETDTSQQAGSGTFYLRPTFMARVRHHSLFIYGTGFSKQHTIQVGISKRKPLQWLVLGNVQSSRSGRVSSTLALPSSLWGERMLVVCLRDTTTGKVACSTAYRYGSWFY